MLLLEVAIHGIIRANLGWNELQPVDGIRQIRLSKAGVMLLKYIFFAIKVASRVKEGPSSICAINMPKCD